MNQIFASCPKGLEELLAGELESLGAEQVRLTVAGVYASGPLSFAYHVCLWSRLANRILLPLDKFDVHSADDLYEGVKSIPWHEHLTPRQSIAVDFVGSNDAIRHTQFGAQRVKDAVVDTLQARYNDRPDVDLRNPDLRINVHLARDKVNVSLDLSGDSLHKRGYRTAMVPAPLKENLAAAVLIRSGWPALSKQVGAALVDPMCGSGTLLIEGAMIAADIAPGLNRRKFGFHGWSQHDADRWQQLRLEALDRCNSGLSKELPEIRGYDKDTRAVRAAQENIACAGLDKQIKVIPKPMSAFKKPTHTKIDHGLMVCNPPYGERWGEMEELRPLYQDLGELAKRECPGWHLSVITGNAELAGELRLRAEKQYKLFNGTIPSQLLLFKLRGEEEQASAKEARKQEANRQPELSEGAQMFANRLKKNERKLNSWLKKSGVSCYRLYDADMPEYAVAVDIYNDAVHVQEYAPPANIDEQQANKHLTEVRQALRYLYPDSSKKLFFKERRRQKGDNQYQRQNSRSRDNSVFTVQEGTARFEVNLSDYLDTGLFLDHRPVRQMIAKMAKGKRFLNLFCYTGAASVHAALGGAKSSLSIDMSNGYIGWAGRNFHLNNMDAIDHTLLRADCLEWLAEVSDRTSDKASNSTDSEYDLIFLDPPTFSNSKKMESVLDIQRDHPDLIQQAMAILAPGGTLVFSNNFRKFTMAESVEQSYQVTNITNKTLDPDFQRNQKIHNCWLIQYKD